MPRPRLLDALEQGASRPVTLVVAPAGYGKTTLLSILAQGHARSIAWLSLDQSDNDPARFWSYIIAAVQSVIPGCGAEALALFRSPQAPASTALIIFLNDLAACQDEVILIVDDYHVIDNRAIQQALAFLLEHLPSNLHVVIATRSMPSLPLMCLRAHGHLVDLNAEDLRFTTAETAMFLRQALNRPFGDAELDFLMTRTEGWIAGLTFAALALNGQTTITSMADAFRGDHHLMVDYLTSEILDRQPIPIQTFLLHTSILDRLSAPLCAALLEGCVAAPSDASQLVLEHLERHNLFLAPLDARHEWYRYHPLFADALRARLRQIHPAHVNEMHRRAAVWLAAHAQPAEAVDHALAAGDLGLAAQLITSVVDDLWLSGEMVTLQRWLAALPDQCIAACPTLAIMHVLMLFNAGHVQQADMALQQLERHADLARDRLGENAASDNFTAFLALLRTIQALAQGAPLPPLPQLPADIGVWGSVVALNLGITYWLHGAVADANKVLESAEKLGRAQGHSEAAFLAAAYRAESVAQMGQLDRAVECYRQLLCQMRSCQLSLAPMASHALLGLGRIYYEWNDLHAAAQLLAEGTALAHRAGKNDVVLDSLLAQARIDLVRGDAARAQALLDEALELARIWNISLYIGRVGAQQMLHWLVQGNVAAATRWARGRGLGIDDPISAMVETEYLALARLRIAQGCIDEALHLLKRIAQVAKRDGRNWRLTEVCVGIALAHQARGDLEPAVNAITEAVTLAEPAGYLRTFIDQGAPIAALLRKVAMRRSAPGCLDSILTAWQTENSSEQAVEKERLAASTAGARYLDLAESLTMREVELLRCLAAGLPNAEIAERLALSPNTVKWHLRNLYAKLGVRSRTQAIAQGRASGLLY